MESTGKDFEDIDLGDAGKSRQWFALVALLLAVAIHLSARFVIWPEEFSCGGLLPDELGQHCIPSAGQPKVSPKAP